jgi:hypothetical protein
MKWIHLGISLLFILFALVQWNDPDALIWVGMYLLIAGIAFLGYMGKFYFWLNLGLTIVLLVFMIFYLPDIGRWMDEGRPSITDSMQASSPHIELIREFFGILISLVVMIFYNIVSQKKKI